MSLSLTAAARVMVAAALIVGVALSAWAQGDPDTGSRKDLEAKKGRLNAEQEAKAKLSKELQANKNRLRAEIERIAARLVETGKQIQKIEARQDAIEETLGKLEVQENTLRAQLEKRHGTISTLLAALQRMGRNPPPVMITHRQDALTMVRSAMLLTHVFPELGDQAAGLKRELGELSRVIGSSREEKEKLLAEKAAHDQVRVKLAALQEEKRQSGAQYEADLRNVGEEVAKIAKNLRKVEQLLSVLDKEFQERAPADAPAKKDMPDNKADEGEAKTAEGRSDAEPGTVLAPSGKRVALNRIKPQVPFAQAKGMLQLPVQGLRVVSFGEKMKFSQSKGIGIQARYGATVVSPSDGLVVYAGEFRTYGQLLIIAPGDGYHVLIAGLSQIDVQVGQSVLMGEPVGVMSSAVGSAAATERGPVLTVEFQKDRKPIDPDPWWSTASRKG